ncbi:hypothetical protein ACHAXS_013410 [Conticribra weissflogii]
MTTIATNPLTASLEILSDGSDYSGGPVIFLTFRRGCGFDQQSGTIGTIEGISSSKPTDENSNKEQYACSYQHQYRYRDESIESVHDDIVARYNLTGIPSLTGRLSSDQSFKLLSGGAFRAIFLSSLVTISPNYTNATNADTIADTPEPKGGNVNSCFGGNSGKRGIVRGASVGGLPALFLNLVQSGYPVLAPSLMTALGSKKTYDENVGNSDGFSDSAPENVDDNECTFRKYKESNNSKYGTVSIVGPDGTDDLVEGVLDTIFGNGRSRPSLRVCEVPSLSNEEVDNSHSCWWEVYTDGYIRVWARSVPTWNVRGLDTGECDAENERPIRLSTDSSSSSHDESSSSSSSQEDDESTSANDDDSTEEVPFQRRCGNHDEKEPNSSSNNNNIPRQKNEDGEQDISDHTLAYIVMILPQSTSIAMSKSRKRKQQSEEEANDEKDPKRPYAFAILSASLTRVVGQIPCPKCGNSHSFYGSHNHWNVFRTLPEEIVSRDDRTKDNKENDHSLLDFVLHLDPLGVWRCVNDWNDTIADPGKVGMATDVETPFGTEVPWYEITIPSWAFSAKIASHHFATFPDRPWGRRKRCPMIDKGILIRAQHRSKLLSTALPFAFSFLGDSTINSSMTEKASGEVMESKVITATGQCRSDTVRKVTAWGLRSCTSVVLNNATSSLYAAVDDRSEEVGVTDSSSPSFTFIARARKIQDRCRSNGFVSWEDSNINNVSSNFVGVNESDLKRLYDFSRIVHSLERAYSGKRHLHADDNEIALDSDDDDDEIAFAENPPSIANEKENANHAVSTTSDCRSSPPLDNSAPHLLVLGTGCATPAPLRGSSAYGLMMPTMTKSLNGEFTNKLVLSAIIECGEGTLTSLYRHRPVDVMVPGGDISLSRHDMQLSHVGFVWISHAHLDHYGDLPNVVQAIANAKRFSCRETQIDRRERNTNEEPPLLVIAPKKVLKYLEIVMSVGSRSDRESGLSHRHRQRCLGYIGVTHREFEFSPFAEHSRSILYQYNLLSPRTRPFATNSLSNSNNSPVAKRYRPFALLRHVEVEHCREAFAMILELRYADDGIRNSREVNSNFSLCFSGDTRPSAQLVRSCRSYSTSQNDNNEILGLHHGRRPPRVPQPWPPPLPPPQISLLIHESTFLNDSQGRNDATKKRHSTTAEALDVARRIGAKACLLSHFSQRYPHVSIDDALTSSSSSSSSIGGQNNEFADPRRSPTVDATENTHPFHWGIAMDGMMIPLTSSGLSTLFDLSRCIDALLGLNSEHPGHFCRS